MHSNQYRIFFVVCLLACLALIPIWAVSHPPLKDYPNHLARMYILMMDGVGSASNRYYEVDWKLLPNLAMDIIVPILGRFFGIEAAGKIFLSAIVVLVLTGTVALHYAVHRRWSAWPLLVALLLYNEFFIWGFVNFLFALGVAFWLSAMWIFFRDNRVAWLLFPLSALGLFLLHLMSFAIYLLIISTFEIGLLYWKGLDSRQILMRGLQVSFQAIPGLILLFLASPTGGGHSSTFFSNMLQKITSIKYLFANYVPFIDFKLTFVPLFVGGLVGLVTNSVRFNRLMLIPLAAMFFTYLALPQTLMSSGGAWRRFVLPLAMLFVVSTDWHIVRAKIRITVTVLAALLFLGRLWVVHEHWMVIDQDLASIRRVMKLIPEGATLYPLEIADDPSQSVITYRSHFPAMAVIDRGAFVPILFAQGTQQPIRFSDAAKKIMRTDSQPRQVNSIDAVQDWADISQYDYVLIMGANKLKENLPPAFRRVTNVDDVALYRIER